MLSILEALGPLTHQMLRNHVPANRRDEAVDAIQELLEGGQIRWTDDNKLEVAP